MTPESSARTDDPGASVRIAAGPGDTDTATELMARYGDRIEEWETGENEILRELARAIRDKATTAGGSE